MSLRIRGQDTTLCYLHQRELVKLLIYEQIIFILARIAYARRYYLNIHLSELLTTARMSLRIFAGSSELSMLAQPIRLLY